MCLHCDVEIVAVTFKVDILIRNQIILMDSHFERRDVTLNPFGHNLAGSSSFVPHVEQALP
jgi:hypothetical protein